MFLLNTSNIEQRLFFLVFSLFLFFHRDWLQIPLYMSCSFNIFACIIFLYGFEINKFIILLDPLSFVYSSLYIPFALFFHFYLNIPEIITTMLGIFCFLLAVHRKQLNSRRILFYFFQTIMHIFFREIEEDGCENVPENVPIIFLIAPHANQFIDPFLVTYCLNKDIYFLAAAKTMRKPFLGLMGRLMEGISIERPQDVAMYISGTVIADGVKLYGTDTHFTSELLTKQIIAAGQENTVVEVISDTELILENSFIDDIKTPVPIKTVPNIDHSEAFVQAEKALLEGKCVGLFPEGGSHDRPFLLPLKYGFAAIAFHVKKINPNLPLHIVPVGLNYFSGHRFRSKVFVHFGESIQITPKQLEMYLQGGEPKTIVLKSLVQTVRESLLDLTISAKDSDTLRFLWAVRRLYKPSNMILPTDQTLDITRVFLQAYDQTKNEAPLVELKEKVEDYLDTIESYGLQDHQVNITNRRIFHSLLLLIYRLLLIICYIFFAIPGTLLNMPIIFFARFISTRKAKEESARSYVKIQGKDIIATWKILVSLVVVPLVLFVYPCLIAFGAWYFGYPAFRSWSFFAFIQPFLMFGAIRFNETVLQIFKSLPPLFLSLFSHKSAFDLRLKRQNIKKKVRETVDQYFNQEIPKNPLLQSLSFHRDHSNSIDITDSKIYRRC